MISNQKSGDDSLNFQAQRDIVLNLGIDEKRAREIFQELNLQQRDNFSRDALELANQRIQAFENSLMQKMEDKLDAFKDPAFQMTLIEAQKSAACTERQADYELLSELLVHKFQKSKDRNINAGINRAVKIVDEIADDALLGLTAFHSVTQFSPTTGNILEGINVLEDLFSKVLYGDLPKGIDWLDHLDILSAVRIDRMSKTKRLSEYYSEVFGGYVKPGIKKNSENHEKAVKLLNEIRLPETILIQHELNEQYLRIGVNHKHKIRNLIIIRQEINFGMPIQTRYPISQDEISIFSAIYDLYDTDENILASNTSAFMSEFDKRGNLLRLRNWWDKIEAAISITSVGRVLAHSNAQRCDNRLPPLN